MLTGLDYSRASLDVPGSSPSTVRLLRGGGASVFWRTPSESVHSRGPHDGVLGVGGAGLCRVVGLVVLGGVGPIPIPGWGLPLRPLLPHNCQQGHRLGRSWEAIVLWEHLGQLGHHFHLNTTTAKFSHWVSMSNREEQRQRHKIIDNIRAAVN